MSRWWEGTDDVSQWSVSGAKRTLASSHTFLRGVLGGETEKSILRATVLEIICIREPVPESGAESGPSRAESESDYESDSDSESLDGENDGVTNPAFDLYPFIK